MRMCARHVDSTNADRSNLVFSSKPIPETEMSNRLITTINNYSLLPILAKYSALLNIHFFVPLARETLGPINFPGQNLLSELGRNLTLFTGDSRESPASYCNACLLLSNVSTL